VITGLLTGLAIFAVAYWLVRRAEYRRDEPTRLVDDVDRHLLEQAEREVRDLDVHASPEEGWEGDDWGPGAPR